MARVDLSMENIRRVCREILDWHFQRARGRAVTVWPGKYLSRRGIFNTSLSTLIIDTILTEFREYRYNGRTYRIVDVKRKRRRRTLIRYADTALGLPE
ncbi:MAG: hypothetical protein QXJ59_06230 [Thermofilaceae archaeon]